ncbi:MAG: glycosyltransferase family 2 protein [Paludibacteraceae bacterium]|nr:glycosyltransferase family 2 protein [Paludibacteraceae bacterium]
MISIIIPIYNTEAYLKGCLDSVLAQTERDVQVVLVDDGSTDGSAAIAQEYARQDTRVEYYHQQHAGQSAARNLGQNYAKGEYIAFVDADDTLAPDWCAKHLAAIEGVDYVQSGYTRVQDSAIICQKTPLHPYLFTSPCMRLYRREAIRHIRFEEGMIYEDVLFSVDLWLSGAQSRIIDYTGYHYTVNPNSTTSRRRPEDEKRVVAQLRARQKNASLRGRMIIEYTIIRLKLHFLKQ